MEDVREQYAEMRDEFYASLEDRKYLSLGEAQKKALQVCQLSLISLYCNVLKTSRAGSRVTKLAKEQK